MKTVDINNRTLGFGKISDPEYGCIPEKRQEVKEMEDVNFKIGDRVSRFGIDRHVVIDISQAGDLIEVECIRRDKDNYYEIFDRKWDAPGKYTLTHRPKHPATKED